MPLAPRPGESALNDLIAECYADPLLFVRSMYPWGQPGELERNDGPYAWQSEYLAELGRLVRARAFDGQTPVSPIQMAVSSGHGIGKSVLVAWILAWILSTRPHSRITVTANTYTQLETRTWATIQRWMSRCLTSQKFEIGAGRIYRIGHKSSWFASPQSCAAENSEAFAGQHAADSTSAYLFDEDSNVPDVIHEVASGGLVKGEPMWFIFGNPTRSTGAFYRAVFGADRHRWISRVIDSRQSGAPVNTQHAEWQQDYGEDSDFFRVRVRGLPPRASDAQFIDQERVLQAQKRDVVVLPDEPLVVGCDLAWGGSDDNVIRFRRGRDARSIPPIRIKGEFTRDPSVLTTRLADVLTQTYDGHRVAMLFLDSAGIAGPIAQRLAQAGHKNVVEVNFGADSPDIKCRYMRDYMWQGLKQWLITGAIDADPQLEADLTGPGIRPDGQQRVWLEDKKSMKSRGLDSPDDADALALTFARVIAAPKKRMASPSFGGSPGAWMS